MIIAFQWNKPYLWLIPLMLAFFFCLPAARSGLPPVSSLFACNPDSEKLGNRSIFDVYEAGVSAFSNKYCKTWYIQGLEYYPPFVESVGEYTNIIGRVDVRIRTNAVPLSVDVILQYDFSERIEDNIPKGQSLPDAIDDVVMATIGWLQKVFGGVIEGRDTGRLPFRVFYEITITTPASAADIRKHYDWRFKERHQKHREFLNEWWGEWLLRQKEENGERTGTF